MTEQKKTPSKRRAKRVRRLKKIIILSIVAGILIPIILCVYLLFRVSALEKQVENLMEIKKTEIVDAAEGEIVLTNENDEQESRNEEAVEEETTEFETEENDQIKYVHLTFDDGPSSVTDDILDILNEYDVKATFFVNGRTDERSLAMYKRIVEEGHTLGMHSYSHKYNEVYASKEKFIADTEKLRHLLAETTGEDPVFYRFPGGSSNRVSTVDMEELIGWLNEEGITYFDWNISSGDSSGGKLTVDQIVGNCTKTVANHEEPVILMHDAGSKRTTVEALPEIIETIQAMGNTKLTAITEDTPVVHHRE